MNVKTVKEARALIGKKVWWDDHGSRYVFLRSGTVDSVFKTQIEIDGNWYSRSTLTSLRDTAAGGAFPNGIEKKL